MAVPALECGRYSRVMTVVAKGLCCEFGVQAVSLDGVSKAGAKLCQLRSLAAVEPWIDMQARDPPYLSNSTDGLRPF